MMIDPSATRASTLRAAEAARHFEPLDRAAGLPPGYSARAHVTRTALLALFIGGFAVWLARRAAPADWLAFPLFLAIANFVEWTVHRGPMHHPMPPRIMYRNHTLIHHRAFLPHSMSIHETRELGLVMMPWYTMLGIFVAVSPIAIGAAALRGPGLAGVFYLAAILYFLTYEALHAAYHLPEPTLRRLGLTAWPFSAMRAHHRHHHRLDRMTHVNFNVTFPLADTVLGTRERSTPIDTAEQAA